MTPAVADHELDFSEKAQTTAASEDAESIFAIAALVAAKTGVHRREPGSGRDVPARLIPVASRASADARRHRAVAHEVGHAVVAAVAGLDMVRMRVHAGPTLFQGSNTAVEPMIVTAHGVGHPAGEIEFGPQASRILGASEATAVEREDLRGLAERVASCLFAGAYGEALALGRLPRDCDHDFAHATALGRIFGGESPGAWLGIAFRRTVIIVNEAQDASERLAALLGATPMVAGPVIVGLVKDVMGSRFDALAGDIFSGGG